MKEFLSSIAIFVLSHLGLYHAPAPTPPPVPVEQKAETFNVGSDGSTYTGGQTYYLSGSGVTGSATSIGLTAFNIPQTGYELTTADVAGVSGKVYLTLESGNRTKQEFVSCTGVTQGSGTTATLTGCSRGLLPFSPYTASSTYQFPHAGGSSAIISNAPAFYDTFASKINDESITGIYAFSQSPTGPVPTTATQFATKTYVDSGLLAGAATSTETVTGISRLATKLQQASSTPTTANTPLVIQAQNATSTYNAGAAGGNGLNVVVTQNDNTIHNMFIATSSVYNWSGNNSHTGTNLFTASTTHTATTTIAASSVTNNALVLNGVPLQAPSSQGAANTVWINNGSGVYTSTTTSAYLGSFAFGTLAEATYESTSVPTGTNYVYINTTCTAGGSTPTTSYDNFVVSPLGMSTISQSFMVVSTSAYGTPYGGHITASTTSSTLGIELTDIFTSNPSCSVANAYFFR